MSFTNANENIGNPVADYFNFAKRADEVAPSSGQSPAQMLVGAQKTFACKGVGGGDLFPIYKVAQPCGVHAASGCMLRRVNLPGVFKERIRP